MDRKSTESCWKCVGSSRGGWAAEESGESRAHTYHYIKVLQKYGTPDTSVSSNTTMSSVFQKNGAKTYVVYNAEKITKKVIFSDGSTFDAAPGWTIKGAADVVAPGIATITIKSVENPNVKKTVTVTVYPAKVAGLHIGNVKKTSLKLSWKKQNGVSGYAVYQYQPKSGKYKLMKKTTKTSFTVKKLKAKTGYKFKVKAYKKSSGTTIYGAYSKVKKGTTK